MFCVAFRIAAGSAIAVGGGAGARFATLSGCRLEGPDGRRADGHGFGSLAVFKLGEKLHPVAAPPSIRA
uniref:hypothetical protein n=1 Tax=Klebsiella pneumoniae TaxID=573 RepID=UPI00195348A7